MYVFHNHPFYTLFLRYSSLLTTAVFNNRGPGKVLVIYSTYMNIKIRNSLLMGGPKRDHLQFVCGQILRDAETFALNARSTYYLFAVG